MKKKGPARARQASPRFSPLDSSAGRTPTLLLFALYVALAQIPILRIGFFADDFIFFDAVRRFPLSEVLIGQHGIYPWYRPLSRELYFLALAGFGEHARLLADALGMAAVLASTYFLYRIGTRFFRPQVAAGAALLFAAGELTRFVAAWASTFQDNLSVALMLGAVFLESERRRVPALLLAMAAPFAKETGFLVWGLLLAYRLAADRKLPGGRWWVAHGLAGTIALAGHLAVRALWQTGGWSFRAEPSIPDLFGRGPADVLRSFFPTGYWPEAWTGWAIAALAGTVAAVLLLATGRSDRRPLPAPREALPWPGILFAATSAALGFAPLVAGNLATLSAPTTYYAYPATPWLACILIAALSRLRPIALAAALPLWITCNLSGLAFREPNFDSFESWASTGRSTWWEQLRVGRATDRLGEDLRRVLADRPESLVVLFTGLPARSYLVLGWPAGPRVAGGSNGSLLFPRAGPGRPALGSGPSPLPGPLRLPPARSGKGQCHAAGGRRGCSPSGFAGARGRVVRVPPVRGGVLRRGLHPRSRALAGGRSGEFLE